MLDICLTIKRQQMKRIIFIRHERAQESEIEIPDFERSLTRKGKKNARDISKKIIKQGIQTDIIFSSPAFRALETAMIYARNFNYSTENIVIQDDLYSAFYLEKCLRFVKSIDNNIDTITFVGHNPYISEIAFDLCEDFYNKIPRGGVVIIDFNISDWKELMERSGTLKLFEHL